MTAEPPLTPRASRRHSFYAFSSVALLTVQGTAMSIVLRYSRIRKGSTYVPSVSVSIAEVLKLVICIAIQVFTDSQAAQQPRGRSASAGHLPSSTLIANPQTPALHLASLLRRALPMIVPAGMFVFQSILLIWAATFLDAVTYQIFNQAFKLVPTAIFARVLLGQRLSPVQWASIPVLATGVILVTLNNGPVSGPSKPVSSANFILGMIACSISGLSSAFAGVYFERYVKGKHAASLIERNIQLGIFGVPFSALTAVIKDGAVIRRQGWLAGFGAAAWGVVGLQVFGGLVTGMVVKYTDNILKNFSLAISVILTVLLAIPLFGQWPSAFFLVGVTLVLLSVFMYGTSPDTAKMAKWLQMASKSLATLMANRQRRTLLILLGAAAIGLTLAGFRTGGWAALSMQAV